MISPLALNSIQNDTFRAYQAAHASVGNFTDLVGIAWQRAKDETVAAKDDDAKAEAARKFMAIFQAFNSFDQDERNTLALNSWNAPPQTVAAMKRKVFDKRPALASFLHENDEIARLLQAKIDATREAEAERARQAIPERCLSGLRKAGYNLTLDALGRLCAAPGAPLDQGFGTGVYVERKAEFVAILEAEAAATEAVAKLTAPAPI